MCVVVGLFVFAANNALKLSFKFLLKVAVFSGVARIWMWRGTKAWNAGKMSFPHRAWNLRKGDSPIHKNFSDLCVCVCV